MGNCGVKATSLDFVRELEEWSSLLIPLFVINERYVNTGQGSLQHLIKMYKSLL
jgi:hypothetical protein